MGDAIREGGLDPFILFLDENHCQNPHLRTALEDAAVLYESHHDHFPAGTPDPVWLPEVGRRGWCLLTTDKRIRRRPLEREAVREYGVRMFYFANNDMSGAAMGITLAKAISGMRALFSSQPAPFTASINKAGEVRLRDAF